MSEWITDRLPTAEDALEDTVLVWDGREAILWTYDGVGKGQPWVPIHKLIAPYVKPKRWAVEWNTEWSTWSINDSHHKARFDFVLRGLNIDQGEAAQRIEDLFNEVMP